MMEAVHRYGGYVVQSTGDGIFALFGAPVAHEDHPQRALYAALRLQEEMRRYSARLREAGNLPIEARVGVNTGEVVVRSIQTDEAHTEYTPIGHSTGLAARMQTLAPTGSIAMTDATRRLCEGYFTFRALGPARIRGVSDAVDVYEVTGRVCAHLKEKIRASRGFQLVQPAEAFEFSVHIVSVSITDKGTNDASAVGAIFTDPTKCGEEYLTGRVYRFGAEHVNGAADDIFADIDK